MARSVGRDRSTLQFVKGPPQGGGPERPAYETVAREIAKRARRRLFVAILPLVLMMSLLAYVLARYGL